MKNEKNNNEQEGGGGRREQQKDSKGDGCTPTTGHTSHPHPEIVNNKPTKYSHLTNQKWCDNVSARTSS